MTTTVFVINSGSTSIKYQLLDVETEERLASGLVERIGESTGAITHKSGDGVVELSEPIASHDQGLSEVMRLFAEHGPDLGSVGLAAVGHRVVHGGVVFDRPVLIDDGVEAAIDDLATLAPLHNPPNLEGIRGARHALPHLPHVAVFDTAFHQTLPPEAYTYAIPRDLAAEHRIRRYGMHGTSHRYVSRETAHLMRRDVAEVNTIVVHIGGGGSMCAVRGGESVEISMGLTPLEGLVMGTRTGDMDLAVLFHLHRVAGLSIDELDTLCNKKSGLLGLGGSPDMRDIRRWAGEGDEGARIAVATFTHRIKAYIGAYYAQLGRLDAIAFTAGIGENDPATRSESLAGLEALGIAVDPALNEGLRGKAGRISPDSSPVQVWVVPTNEELEIAREAVELIGA
jgi:acetate kinase